MVKGSNLDDLKYKTESCLKSHLTYLDHQGMVTNISETEVVVIGCNSKVELEIPGNTIKSGECVKVLCVLFDSSMKWSSQAETVIGRSRKLNSCLKFLQRKLNGIIPHAIMVEKYGWTKLNSCLKFLQRKLNGIIPHAIMVEKYGWTTYTSMTNEG